MINLLPEEEKQKERVPKKEEPQIEMRQPVKIKSPKSEIKPESKAKIKPEPKLSPPSAEKKISWLQKFIQSFKRTTKKEKVEREEIKKLAEGSEMVIPEVTLMAEELPITKRMIQEKLLILLAVLVFSILIVFVGWLWATWRFEVAQEEIHRIKTDMATVEAQIASYNELVKEIRGLEQKAERVNNLLNNHIYWTKFFKLLETYTIPDVYYGDFNADTSGKIVLPSVGRDLIAAARQLIAFSNAPDFVQTVTITDLTGGVKGVSFNTNLILVPTAFKK